MLHSILSAKNFSINFLNHLTRAFRQVMYGCSIHQCPYLPHAAVRYTPFYDLLCLGGIGELFRVCLQPSFCPLQRVGKSLQIHFHPILNNPHPGYPDECFDFDAHHVDILWIK